MKPKRLSSLLAVLALALALGGCGEREKTAQEQTEPAAQTAPAPEPAGASSKPRADKAEKAKPDAPPPEKTAAATPGTTIRDTELKEKAYLDAKTLQTLPAQTSISILGRQGGWLKVSARGQQGWVRMLNVRSGSVSEEPKTTAKDVKDAAALATGRTGTGNIVATSGIRGLTDKQLQAAKGDPAELKKMESYAVSKQAAAEYARAHGLQSGKVAYLPVPK